jgi:hypothetical protein
MELSARSTTIEAMMTSKDLAQVSLLLDLRIREALVCHWEVNEAHPRQFGPDSFEAQQARQRALHDTRSVLMNAVPADPRPVGVQAPQEVIYLCDLLREAVGQIAYEIESAQPARLIAIARKLHAWDDARQCADDLAIRAVDGHQAALAELDRVGLGWTVGAAQMSATKSQTGRRP